MFDFFVHSVFDFYTQTKLYFGSYSFYGAHAMVLSVLTFNMWKCQCLM